MIISFDYYAWIEGNEMQHNRNNSENSVIRILDKRIICFLSPSLLFFINMCIMSIWVKNKVIYHTIFMVWLNTEIDRQAMRFQFGQAKSDTKEGCYVGKQRIILQKEFERLEDNKETSWKYRASIFGHTKAVCKLRTQNRD